MRSTNAFGASPPAPVDPLEGNPDYVVQVVWVEQRMTRKLLAAARAEDPGLVLELVYTYDRVVKNIDLPAKLRLSALMQLRSTILGLTGNKLSDPTIIDGEVIKERKNIALNCH